MSKIKSKIAKNALGDLSFVMGASLEAETTAKICDTVENIVVRAEQDAEERAVRILEEFIAEGLLLTKEDEIVSKFKESLNGDQSDE